MREQRRRRRLRFLRGVLAVVTAILTLLPLASAVAQDEEGEPAEPQPLTVTQEGYYTNSSGNAVPPTVSDRFPPGVVCLVFPEACSSTTRPVTGPIDEVLQDNQPEEVIQDDEAPAQPAVVEGTLPTGISGGAMRYVSALRFDLPPVPENRELVKAELILDQAGTNYRSDSPAFREAVEAAIVCGTTRTQEACQREFGQALQPEGGHFRSGEEVPYRVDVCQILGEWAGEDNQDWQEQPEVDCIVNVAAGLEDPAGTWTFDITFIVQSWLDGTAQNRGLLIAPQSAENLAFGDPDTSNNAQISFAGGSYQAPDGIPPQIRYEVTEATTSGSVTTLPPLTSGGGDDTSTTSSSEDTFQPSSSPPRSSSSGLGTSAFGPIPSVTADEAASAPPEPAPEVAEPPPAVAGAPVAAERAAPYTPWWVWLLIPLGLAGLYVLARSLEAEPEAPAEERAGAMTRLINQRLARSSAAPLVQV